MYNDSPHGLKTEWKTLPFANPSWRGEATWAILNKNMAIIRGIVRDVNFNNDIHTLFYTPPEIKDRLLKDGEEIYSPAGVMHTSPTYCIVYRDTITIRSYGVGVLWAMFDITIPLKEL